MKELYKVYRPKTLEEVVGQTSAVNKLQTFLDNKHVPHSILFTGPSGTGKTTLARILRRSLKCHTADFNELNIADVRGIDEVRSIQSRIGLAPLSGNCRIWLLDECHNMVKLAQDCILKMLEDTPSHVYFMLATTDPQKLLPTIRTRCTSIKVNSLEHDDLLQLIRRVLKAESVKLSDEVKEKIIEHSDGSARKCLVILDSVYQLKTEAEQLAAIEADGDSKEGIDLARLLFNGAKWPEVAKCLKEIKGEPESIRRVVLGYVSAIALNGGKLGRCELIMQAFSDPIYDTQKVWLVKPCLEIVGAK